MIDQREQGHSLRVQDVFELLDRLLYRGEPRREETGGPVPLPDGASFGWFSDPEGNTIGVYAAKK